MNYGFYPALWKKAGDYLNHLKVWGAGLLGIFSLAALGGVPVPGACPCCGGMYCPNGTVLKGLLGAGAALALQLWSYIATRRARKNASAYSSETSSSETEAASAPKFERTRGVKAA